MKTSSGKPLIGIDLSADPNIKKLPNRLIHKVLSRLFYIIFLKLFRFPQPFSLLFSEIVCIMRHYLFSSFKNKNLIKNTSFKKLKRREIRKWRHLLR